MQQLGQYYILPGNVQYFESTSAAPVCLLSFTGVRFQRRERHVGCVCGGGGGGGGTEQGSDRA